MGELRAVKPARPAGFGEDGGRGEARLGGRGVWQGLEPGGAWEHSGVVGRRHRAWE